jgi:GT2 family glycosyltransferase
LNYCGAKHTLACVDALQSLSYQQTKILVVDNASPDHSAEQLQQYLLTHPDAFTLIESAENNGYSAGNNLGILFAQAEARETGNTEHGLIWLLNNDTLPAPEALTELVNTWKQKPNSIVGSLLRYPDGRYQQVGTRINGWTGSSKGYPEKALMPDMTVESLTGASMLVPLSVFDRVGLLDESYFLYFEDAEFCMRCQQFGIPCIVALQSVVLHEEGATTGRKSFATQYYFHRNRLFLLNQHAKGLQPLTLFLYSLFRLVRATLKSLSNPAKYPRKALWVLILALTDFWKGVRGPCPHLLNQTP